MSLKWREIIRVAFKGERFANSALNQTALSELLRLCKIISETAEALYHENNPGRKLPPHFNNRTNVWLRRIEAGSAVAPLEVMVGDESQSKLFEPPPEEVDEAADLAYATYSAIENDQQLHNKLPKSLIKQYAEFGCELRNDEAIEIIPVRPVSGNRKPARITNSIRTRWEAFKEMSYQAYADITGQVLMVDIKHLKFQIWVDDKAFVTVGFTTDQEEQITTALKDYETRKLHIIGRGEFTGQGKLSRILEVEKMVFATEDEPVYDLFTRPIEDVIADFVKDIPDEEWNKLPSDLSENIDFYLTGGSEK